MTSERCGTIKQVFLGLSASVGFFSIGLVRGYSATAVPSMESTTPELVPSIEIMSWISSAPPLGAFVGSLMSGALMNFMGRKGALMLTAPILMTGWGLIANAPSSLILIFGRVICGYGVGISLTSTQLYVTECADVKIRGLIGSLPSLFGAMGVLSSYTMGYFFEWDHLAMLSAISPCLMFILLLRMPESPIWLTNKNQCERAAASKKWLQGGKPCQVVPQSTVHPPLTWETFKKSSIITPFLLVATICFFQQTSGIDTIIFYTVSIFQASNSTLDGYKATIVVGAVQLFATLMSIFLVDNFGRRPLLILSGVSMGCSMATLAVYFYLHQINVDTSLGFVPLFSQLLFITGYSIGFGNIPYLLMGELLSLQNRCFFSSCVAAITLTTAFISVKTYPDLRQIFGMEGVFGFYSVFCFSATLFVLLFLPETKGKSLREIEEYFLEKEKITKSLKTPAHK